MAHDNLILSVSGLRGTVGLSLTPEVIVRYSAACAENLPQGTILVGRDGRPSGLAITRIIEGTLCAMGRSVLSAGVVATPTVGVLTSQWRLAGAIQVTASHNPSPYNGLKVFDSTGRVVSPELGQKIRLRYEHQPWVASWASYERIGQLSLPGDTVSDHMARVLATVDAPQIRRRRFHVFLDCNHGAGSQLAVPLLEALGCTVTVTGETPDGLFAHPPEPIEENLRQVARAVVAAGADIGFCQDPDADRLAVIDEQGTYIGEEYTLAFCVARRLKSTPGPVVINCATSRMTEDICQQHGVPCFRTPVGEAYVVNQMQAVGAVFGGEGNGGPIDPRVGWVRDSFVGMAQILDFLAQSGLTVSQWVASLPKYAIYKSRITCPASDVVDKGLQRLMQRFPDAQQVDRRDGLRWEWADRWLLVRPSNTEPIVRIIAEAPSKEEAMQLVREAEGSLAQDTLGPQ